MTKDGQQGGSSGGNPGCNPDRNGDPHIGDASDLNIEIGQEAPSDWSELLAADSDADFFHTKTWTRSIGRCYPGKTPLWLTVRIRERLVGGMAIIHSPGRMVDHLESNIEGTSGGPLIARDIPVDMAASLFLLLVDHFHQMRSAWLGSLSLSLNSGHEERFGNLLSDDSRWIRHHHPAAVLSLAGGIDEVEQMRMNKTKRSERNRGLKRGVELEISQDPELLAQYYPVYLRASGKWGIEPAPLAFLQELLAPSTGLDVGQEQVFFTCVRIKGRVVGGHLNLHFGDRVIAWTGVTDPEFSRYYYPSTVAIWGDIVESCRRGAQWLDLGGSGGQVKLGDFKRYLGAEEQVRGWYVSDTAALRLLRSGRAGMRNLLGRSPEP